MVGLWGNNEALTARKSADCTNYAVIITSSLYISEWVR